MSYTNFQQIQLLRQENTTLWVKLDSVQQIVKMKAVKPQPAPKKSTGSAFLDFLIELNEESEKEPASAKAKQKVIVSSKYRLEDRYVSTMILIDEVRIRQERLLIHSQLTGREYRFCS